MKTNKLKLLVVAALLLGLPLALTATQDEGRRLTVEDEDEGRRLTVEDAVAIALRNNLELSSEELTLEKRRRTRDTAWNRFIPTVSAGTTLARPNETPSAIVGFDLGQPVEVEGPAWNISGELAATLNLNLGSIYGIRAARFDYEAGLIDIVDARNRIERDVRKAFFGLLVLDQQVLLRQEALQIAAERLEQTMANYDSGLVDEFTLLSEEVSYENQRPELEALLDRQRAARRQFNRDLGLPLTTQLQLDGSIDPEMVQLDVERLIARKLPGATAIQQIQDGMRQLENAILLAKSGGDPQTRGFYPSLTFRYAYNPTFQRDPFGDPWFDDVADDWSDRGAFSITLTQPLDTFLPSSQTRTRISNLETDLADARIAMESTFQALELQVRNLGERLDQLQRNIASRERNQRLAERAFELAAEAYAAGTRELLDVRNAEQELQTAQLQVLQGKLEYIEALLDLQYILNANGEQLGEQSND
ncbi:MAG: TolC family protein [Spirochaetaceae bacterium]|nr:MAG: TolC family protein [Spirochaetaceae bacterium]